MAVRRQFQRRPQRRKRVWARSNIRHLGASVTPLATDLLLEFKTKLGANALPGATVGAIRWNLLVTGVGANTLTDDVNKAFIGMIVAPDAVEAVDIDPLIHPHLNWMWWEIFPFHQGATGENTRPEVRETGSMRKLEELNETLWLVTNHTIETGTTGIQLDFGISTLLILP